MLLRRIALRHFRNFHELAVDFGPHINAIWGINAQGKSSLLEAIFLCVSGRSFRSPQIRDLLKFGESYFFVQADFRRNDVEQHLHYAFDGTERKIQLNSTRCQSTAELLGVLPGVMMTPDDISLVKGSPLNRRRFLDLQLSQANPTYLHHLIRFQQAMKQRNQLLKDKHLHTLSSWEEQMALSATYLVLERQQEIIHLQNHANRFYACLCCSDDPLSLRYRSQAPVCEGQTAVYEYFVKRYQELRPKELEVGYTLLGPHKDDLIIEIEGNGSRFFASEGQQRSCVTALRMAEWHRLREQAHCHPLLLIDDFGMGLDEQRRQRLIGLLGQFEQVFLSSASDPRPLLTQETSLHSLEVVQGTVA